MDSTVRCPCIWFCGLICNNRCGYLRGCIIVFLPVIPMKTTYVCPWREEINPCFYPIRYLYFSYRFLAVSWWLIDMPNLVFWQIGLLPTDRNGVGLAFLWKPYSQPKRPRVGLVGVWLIDPLPQNHCSMTSCEKITPKWWNWTGGTISNHRNNNCF